MPGAAPGISPQLKRRPVSLYSMNFTFPSFVCVQSNEIELLKIILKPIIRHRPLTRLDFNASGVVFTVFSEAYGSVG